MIPKMSWRAKRGHLDVRIYLLKNYPEAMPQLAHIWLEVLGKIWVPDITIEHATKRFMEHLNDDALPLTLVAFESDTPVGMCSLRVTDGIRAELTPWLGSLVVDPTYQGLGIGKMLIDSTKEKAKEMGYARLYLFTFDLSLQSYYSALGWKKIGMDEFAGHPVIVMEVEL